MLSFIHRSVNILARLEYREQMKISAFDRYDQQDDLRPIGASKIRALSPRQVFSASRACARVSSEVKMRDYAV